ncbi:hypothetical protein RND81_09G263200 [Saponaria officinalis]|uniref:Uncharacterized protein n=1 Tax=Saponaria officinalis TaxID=3572 RepID=A0AAW1IS98_SAPOF
MVKDMTEWRHTKNGKKYFKLTHFWEAFTSHRRMVQIYKLKPQRNRIKGRPSNKH